MREISFESRVQISENGSVILYEKRYHGVLMEDGGIRLKEIGGVRHNPHEKEARNVRVPCLQFIFKNGRNRYVYEITGEQYVALVRTAQS